MAIFGAIGLALTIIVLKVLVPEIFQALEGVILSFLSAADMLANVATQVAATASSLPH
jgi:hypothetical protein